MSTPTYDADYFLNKFRVIPEELWFVGGYTDPTNSQRHCALGLCGETQNLLTPESCALRGLFGRFLLRVERTNDTPTMFHPQPTPKQRIIAALEYIKANQ